VLASQAIQHIAADPDPGYEVATRWVKDFAARMAENATDPVRAREVIVDEMRKREGDAVPSDVLRSEGELGGVRVWWVTTPNGSGSPVFMYLHSGGFLFGSVELDDLLLSRIARQTGGRAVSVDYRLAPEHPYPAALDDAVAAYRALIEQVDPSQVVVSGESSGGGLAVLMLQAARKGGLPMPAGAVLMSPMVDYTASGSTFDTNAATDFFISREAAQGAAVAWLNRRDLQEYSPLFNELRELPPLLIQVGSTECFHDDARRLQARVTAAGGEAALEVYDGVHHMWHGFPALKQAALATERVANFVHRVTRPA
jgi:acetyl esterase/lipase